MPWLEPTRTEEPEEDRARRAELKAMLGLPEADLADVEPGPELFFLAEREDFPTPIHIGPDADLSIAEVAETVKQIVGYAGALEFDATKPDGAPLKRLDASPLRGMGWKPRMDFADGLRETYAAFLSR